MNKKLDYLSIISQNKQKSKPSLRIKARRTSAQGFTIVELLIVIVVIAILAAITIIAYNGITNRAIETSMQSDLKNSSTVLELEKTTTGIYPVDAASVNNGQGLKASGDNTLTYIQKPYGYCVSVTSPRSTKTFAVKSSTNQVSEGDCEVMVSTLAGGTWGYADGTGAAAMFSDPRGVAVDSAGNIYVADASNFRIRKISPAGVVTTLAGSTQGYADGTGAAARFWWPDGIAIDSDDNIYVADSNNHRIRKISPAGVVTTFAGSGTAGSTDGTGVAAQFNSLTGIAVDSTGAVYVAEQGNDRIRKISPAGVVTTLAGSTQGYADGTGAAARFNNPQGVAVDSSGTVYIADSDNFCIRKISPAAVVSTFAGECGTWGTADGTGGAARFGTVNGLTLDSSGALYVTDADNNRIRKISPSGVVTTFAGSGDQGHVDGVGATAQLNWPWGIAVGGEGTLYVADYGWTSGIRKIVQ